MPLHDRMKFLRSEKRLTQVQISRLLDISRVTYTHYEIGARTPDLEMLMRIADLHQVSLDYLSGYSDRRPTSDEWQRDRSAINTRQLSKDELARAYRVDIPASERVAEEPVRDQSSES